MGQMWHSLLLGKWKELFFWLPIDRILSALGDKTLPAADLMVRLGLSHKPTFRKNYLNPALEQKLIERTIPDKPNSKNQKYRKHQKLF